MFWSGKTRPRGRGRGQGWGRPGACKCRATTTHKSCADTHKAHAGLRPDSECRFSRAAHGPQALRVATLLGPARRGRAGPVVPSAPPGPVRRLWGATTRPLKTVARLAPGGAPAAPPLPADASRPPIDIDRLGLTRIEEPVPARSDPRGQDFPARERVPYAAGNTRRLSRFARDRISGDFPELIRD